MGAQNEPPGNIEPKSLDRTRRHRRGAVHGRAGRGDRQRRAAVDQGRSRLQRGKPPVGDHRLRDHVRRRPPPWRTDVRPARPAAPVHRRARPVHDRVAALGARVVGGIPDRLPRPAGPRRRPPLPRCPLDPDHDLRRGTRAQHGARRVGRRVRQRRRCRRPARRAPRRARSTGPGSSSSTSRSASSSSPSRRCLSARAGPSSTIATSTSPAQRRSRPG